ncbi:excinuclease ABC subunit UvrB [Candidatus Margulisiibacteriota bacterium]
MFKLKSDFKPGGDQPGAIDQLISGLEQNKRHQVLMGVTGSGKTFTIANVIQKLNRPVLVMAHNKTLAAQLCAEFREFFPDSAVEYFVSYYDYYQPEAYIPARDLYIEKEADINEEIERLRHSATRSLLMRRDVIIVASVSCIYGLGMPEDYIKGVIFLEKGSNVNRRQLLLNLERVQYERNDIELKQGRYRVKGETIDIFPSWAENLVRLEFFGDELEKIFLLHPVSGEVLEEKEQVDIYPATHYVINQPLDNVIDDIYKEMYLWLEELKAKGKDFEAKRLETRIKYDMEMMREIGYCKGIENYSRIISGRQPGDPPGVLLDFFPDDFITIIDESHVTVPQVRGMFNGDRSRKQVLVDHGFRLPSAMDNRPLRFEEFSQKIGPCIYVSATPGPYELEKCLKKQGAAITGTFDDYQIVEQIIRPTGLVDPEVVVKPTKYQVDDLISEIDKCLNRQERALVTTITKKMAEDLSGYLDEKGIKVRYLHSDIKALDRIDILHDLRVGTFHVLVGVNLLREGLDLPEVSLVAIMDADKEGFLRNERSLIQTIGRAARNINGRVVLYADNLTRSIQAAVQETNRRRSIQLEHNKKHGIKPVTITKKVTDIRSEERETLKNLQQEKENIAPDKLPDLIAKLEKDMKMAAKNLEFELAAVIRDQLEDLKNL